MRIKVELENWPLHQSFTISRGTKSSADVISVTVTDGEYAGRGECVPYARYGETPDSVLTEINALQDFVLSGRSRQELQGLMQPGAARNALDCALWDLEARKAGRPVWQLAGLPEPLPLLTAYTISLDTPENMARSAHLAGRPLLKLKLGGDGDQERLRAIRAAVPGTRLIADANEAWPEHSLLDLMTVAQEVGLELIEQPLPAGNDRILASIPHLVPVCADESVHASDKLSELKGLYDVVNIKLDKTGGLTEAIRLAEAAEKNGFRIMLGCMVGTSLAMAPATLLGSFADWVDLDGPLLLSKDRPHPIQYAGSVMHSPHPELWGNAKR